MWLLWFVGCVTQPHWPDEKTPGMCDAGAGPQVEAVLKVDRPARRRLSLIWAPSGPGPHDVIVNFHEFRSEPRRQQHYTGWIELAKKNNAYLLGPDGKTSMWNAGGCCGKARDRQIDDIGFLDQMIEELNETGCTTGKVLATGIGNGGMMAHHWACNSDVPDAVVSVGGALQTETCEQKRPIPVLMYHGLADEWMPLDGSGNHVPLSVAEREWKKRNAAAQPLPAVKDDVLSCSFYGGTKEVGVCLVDGMKDHWPGAEDAPLVNVRHPLGRASEGAFEWVKARW